MIFGPIADVAMEKLCDELPELYQAASKSFIALFLTESLHI